MATSEGTPDLIAAALTAILATHGLPQKPQLWPVCKEGGHEPSENITCEVYITYCADCGRPKHYSFSWDTQTYRVSVFNGLLASIANSTDEDDDGYTEYDDDW